MCILHVYQFLCWKRRKRCLYIWPRTFTHITSLYGPWNHLDCSSCHKLEMSGHFFFTLSDVFLSCKSLYVKYVLTVLCTNEEKGYLKAVYFKWFPTCEPNIWSLPVLKSVSFSAAVAVISVSDQLDLLRKEKMTSNSKFELETHFVASVAFLYRNSSSVCVVSNVCPK